jgi:hypothetical protein
MKNRHLYNFFVFVVSLALLNCQSQKSDSEEQGESPTNFSILEDQIYTFNNAFKYDSSKALLLKTLEQPKLSSEQTYQCYLLLSYTHKRLFDYPRVMVYLDSAQNYALKSVRKDSLIANIFSQKALALFDVRQYDESDSMMKKLAATKYAYLDDEYKAKIIMQEAYIKFLKKDYKSAENKYAIALQLLKKSSPCDLPMIYGKQIELYGDMGDNEKIAKTLQCRLLPNHQI